MKTIVLCRHAKSDWPENVPDIDRPLKGRGVKDALRLGELLASHDFSADLILSSPANRALSTAKIIAGEIGYESEVQINKSLYFEGVGAMVSLIAKLPSSADTIMLFGHNPTMEEAARYFLKMDGPFSMPTSGMVCIETHIEDWQKFTKQYLYLRWVQIPRLKRKDGDS